MKNLLLLFVSVLCTSISMAQTKMPQSEIQSFKTKVKSEAQKINSIAADFEESKYVSVLKNAAESSGIFRYKNEKMLWKYHSPKQSAMLFDKNQLNMSNDKGKKSTIDLNKNKRFKQIQQLMVGSYTGELFDENAFNIDYLKNNTEKLAVLTPKRKDMARYIKEVVLTFKSHEYTVSDIKIVESSGDYSIIKLKNKKLNTTISDSEFKL